MSAPTPPFPGGRGVFPLSRERPKCDSRPPAQRARSSLSAKSLLDELLPRMFQRVFKSIAALGIGQVLHILSQLAMPPVFIAAYGVDGFALWLLLTAAISHLNTLDFGLQTYLVNELTLLYHGGKRERFHQV